MKLTSFGASDTVTGSLHMLEFGTTKILVDAGLFQGSDEITNRNFEPLLFDITKVDSIFLTHAHYDHCAKIPLLIKKGFQGKIFCTRATRELAEIILNDSVNVSESNGESLYTLEDVQLALSFFKICKTGVEYSEKNFNFYLGRAGHILGAVWVKISVEDKNIVFSGDLGRSDDILIPAPEIPTGIIDLVVLESTYGDRQHAQIDGEAAFEELLKRVLSEKKVWIIPSFAMARAQNLMALFSKIIMNNKKLKIPIWITSPMTEKIIDVYLKNKKLLSNSLYFEKSLDIIRIAKYQKQIEKLDKMKGPAIIISSSGMLSGGRIQRIVKNHGKAKNNILSFVGFQSPQTLGHEILNGKREFPLDGKKNFVLACEVMQFDFLSAHADQIEMKNWLLSFKPKAIHLVHGEEETQIEFKKYLEKLAPTTISYFNKSILIK